jgi:hypothetical protein
VPTEATKYRIFPVCLGNLTTHYGASCGPGRRAPNRLDMASNVGHRLDREVGE